MDPKDRPPMSPQAILIQAVAERHKEPDGYRDFFGIRQHWRNGDRFDRAYLVTEISVMIAIIALLVFVIIMTILMAFH